MRVTLLELMYGITPHFTPPKLTRKQFLEILIKAILESPSGTGVIGHLVDLYFEVNGMSEEEWFDAWEQMMFIDRTWIGRYFLRYRPYGPDPDEYQIEGTDLAFCVIKEIEAVA
jgi:hypothetical protein